MSSIRRIFSAKVSLGSFLAVGALALAAGSGVSAVFHWDSPGRAARATASVAATPEVQRWLYAEPDAEIQGWRLSNGAVIDVSCGERLSAEDRAIRLARMEAAVKFASEQAPRCFQAYRFPDPTNVAPTLSNARLVCAELEGANAKTSIVKYHGYHFLKRPFLPLMTSAHYDRSYVLEMNVGPLSDLDQGRVTDVAKTVFHETLHYYSNNSVWHNDPEKDHESTGCERSMYTDRIYFLSGVCFPLSYTGLEMHLSGIGAAGCENVCDEAFSRVDSGSVPPPFLFYGAEALRAAPLKPGDRRISCGRVKAAHLRRNAAFADMPRLGKMIQAGARAFPEHMMGSELYRDFAAFDEVVFGAHQRFGSARAAMARYDELRARFTRSFDRVCEGGDPSDSRHNDLCLNRRVRLFGMLDHLRTHLMRFEDADFLLFRAVPDPGKGKIVRMTAPENG